MKEFEDLIKKAERFLHTAEYILSTADYDSCASRCYYAMFFMAEAARDFVQKTKSYLRQWADREAGK